MSDFDGNITPAGAWSDVPQLATTAQLLGGTGGPLNAQAVALAARTEKLKTDLTTLADDVAGQSANSGFVVTFFLM